MHKTTVLKSFVGKAHRKVQGEGVVTYVEPHLRSNEAYGTFQDRLVPHRAVYPKKWNPALQGGALLATLLLPASHSLSGQVNR